MGGLKSKPENLGPSIINMVGAVVVVDGLFSILAPVWGVGPSLMAQVACGIIEGVLK